MFVIELFAGPGTGKSTTAAELYSLMKHAGMNVELVTEFAKDLTWDESFIELSDSLLVVANQHHRLYRLKGKVDFVITDSPFLLTLAYTPGTYFENFEPLVREMWNDYEHLNVMLKRQKAYSPVGRNQTETEARGLDGTIRGILERHDQDYLEIVADRDAAAKIYNHLLPKMLEERLSYAASSR